ncbi:glycosylphosphatidylinositol anchor biosynthesis [Basidiobolus ranarum]|uniref:Mannosyltransferase n=1 Tax=Basidiobolus ranarum TaxID=34480 RepID=A0ABR2WME0_9FUNG
MFTETRLFCYLWVFRLVNAYLNQTFFVPDEYWQTLEVAHHWVFGYGYLTWEWKEKIRSFAHPLIFAICFEILKLCRLDDTKWLIVLPYIIQAFFAALLDLYTYKTANRIFGSITAKFTLFCSIISWFNFFCSTRLLANSLEASLTIMALYYWPFTNLIANLPHEVWLKQLSKALSLAVLACVLRPTTVVIWIFLGLVLLVKKANYFLPIIYRVITIGALGVAGMVTIDYGFYGEWILVPYNFYDFNVTRNISLFYGSHPWHWYLSQGLPIISTTFIPFWIYGAIKSKHRELFFAAIWVSFGYSLLGHKEFRFIYIILPILLMYSGHGLAYLVTNKWRSYKVHLLLFLVLTNVPMAIYMSQVHQRGVVDVMDYLKQEAHRTDSNGQSPLKDIGFLMPCHSTPYYAHLHKNINMWFITCQPPLNLTSANDYKDESDVFYEDPLGFLNTNFEPNGSRKWPSHLVLFEALVEQIRPKLAAHGYHECARIFNSHFHDDSRRNGAVLVYCM